MPYQALLFCPDEKTARTVTQVLSDLDFAVVPCTEPFAAVKRLMAEHFDAVVVDCDNEQNATLLFKSAHNSSNNQTSLAVAVVEGQAGVTKAFRIGANLVLTKPINVEQAKGTLRVARGLLRKSEAARPASASSSATAKSAAPRPTPNAATESAPTSRTGMPMAPSSALTPKAPAPRPAVAGMDSTTFCEAPEEIHEPVSAARANIHPDQIVSGAASAAAASNSGAASAPARARVPQEQVSEETTSDTSSPEHEVGQAAEVGNSASTSKQAVPAPASTFDDAASAQASGGGSKKALLAIAAVVLVAAAGYAAWMQFQAKSSSPVQVVKPAAPASKPGAQQASPSTSPVESESAAAGSVGPAPDSSAPDPTKPSHSSSPTSKVIAPVKPAQQPIVIKANSSLVPAPQPASTADVPPSALGIATPGSSGSLPGLLSTDGSASQPMPQTVKVSQGVSQGLLYKKVQPTYPPSALHMRVEGAVELMATISKRGDITDLKVLGGTPLLTHAAADAVKQWKYKPYLLNGEPVEMQTQITVKFKLPR
jgi:protein TonB